MKNMNLLKFIIGVLAFLLASVIFSDWENFKAGLKGKEPVIDREEEGYISPE